MCFDSFPPFFQGSNDLRDTGFFGQPQVTGTTDARVNVFERLVGFNKLGCHFAAFLSVELSATLTVVSPQGLKCLCREHTLDYKESSLPYISLKINRFDA